MWSISDLKNRARGVLKKHYWMAFVVCLLINGLMGMISSIVQILTMAISMPLQMAAVFQEREVTDPEAIMMVLVIFVVSAIVMTLINAFLIGPITVGQNRFYMRLRMGHSEINSVLFGFSNGYRNLVKTQFLVSLYAMLWSFLLIVPGIIKTYEYSMVPYLLAENPKMETRRAFELSRLMTNGEKFKIFALQISFAGWWLLGAMACGIGVIFVPPYQFAAMAELYATMRDKAFYEGHTNPQELSGFGDISTQIL